MLLFTSGVAFFFAASVATALRSGLAAGVKGSLKGCAADVDVAVGGVCVDEASPCRAAVCVAVVAEMGAALRRGGVVELRKRAYWCRCDCWERVIWVWTRDAARMQDRHIILGGLCVYACVYGVAIAPT